jgi:hypothetical protein
MAAIEKGNDGKLLLMGAGAVLAAAAVVGVALLTDITLKVGRLELPQWSLFIVAVALLGAGLVTAFMGMGVERCSTCKESLVNHEAYFGLEFAPAVVAAVQRLDPSELERLAPVPKAQMKSVASVSYCEKCRAVGTVQASKWQDYQPHELSPEVPMQGPVVARFATLAEKHLAFRGEDEDD